MNILILVIILLVLVLVHEWGHFFTAKRFGIRVDEFGFGFPPKLFGKKIGETEYTVNAIPFGGFVKIFGENPDEENTNGPDSARSFVNKPRWQQAIVLVAGVFMNFLLAWLLFAITFFAGSPLATDSIPSHIKSQMTQNELIVLTVVDQSPASVAGVKSGDFIVSAHTSKNSISNPSAQDFINFVSKAGESIDLSVVRDGKPININVTPKADAELGRAIIGISPGVLNSGKFGFFQSIQYGFETALMASRDTLFAFGKLFSSGPSGKLVRDSIVGPVGLVQIVGIVAHVGIGYLISFAGVISVSLAVINLVPFPALDGGRLFFLLIEKIKGSRIKPKVANIANTAGFVILILLMILVTYHDIVR